VVVLASNMRQNIDESFVRRIHMVVEFPAPDAEARFRIWRGMFPAGVGRPNDDELRLVAEQFRLAGGNIKNVVVDAAHRALAEAGIDQPQISLRHLVLATAREYQKLGRPITRGEFSAEFYAVIQSDLLLA
jgi:SpoVK/Ycf46/Vps4 family AAA+-type ATPase